MADKNSVLEAHTNSSDLRIDLPSLKIIGYDDYFIQFSFEDSDIVSVP